MGATAGGGFTGSSLQLLRFNGRNLGKNVFWEKSTAHNTKNSSTSATCTCLPLLCPKENYFVDKSPPTSASCRTTHIPQQAKNE